MEVPIVSIVSEIRGQDRLFLSFHCILHSLSGLVQCDMLPGFVMDEQICDLPVEYSPSFLEVRELVLAGSEKGSRATLERLKSEPQKLLPSGLLPTSQKHLWI